MAYAESTNTTKKTTQQKSSAQDSKKQTTKKQDTKKDDGKKQVKKPGVEKSTTKKRPATSSNKSPEKQSTQKPGQNPEIAQPKETLGQIHARIEALTKELDTNTEAHADATDALKESEQSISETNRKLYELNQQQSQSRSSLNTLQQQKTQLESTIQQQRQLLGAQLYQQYLNGQQSYLQVLLQQQNPAAISRQLQYFTYVSQARAKAIASMQKNLGKVAQLNDQTADTLKQISDLKADQEQSRKALQAEKEARSQLLKTLSAKIDAQRNEISKLKRDEKSLSDLVERLARAAAQAARKPKPVKPVPADNPRPDSAPTNQPPVARNDTLPIPGFDGGNFAALRGKLNLPVRGDVTNRFGASREDTGVSWKGLFIKAAEGSEVKSIASGRVVFADWMRGFGNLLIVDHGNGYMSLYGNNQALLKKAGDLVNSGDTIAAVGNTGGNQDNGLYYELRYQSKPLDPLSWSVTR